MLSGGDLRGALTGAAAPEIAYLIGQHITDNSDSDRKNVVAGTIAHAVVNVALARLSGGDAGAAAAGAATGELVGQLAVALYNKPPELLSEDEKQFISGLSTLASGLAGGRVITRRT